MNYKLFANIYYFHFDFGQVQKDGQIIFSFNISQSKIKLNRVCYVCMYHPLEGFNNSAVRIGSAVQFYFRTRQSFSDLYTLDVFTFCTKYRKFSINNESHINHLYRLILYQQLKTWAGNGRVKRIQIFFIYNRIFQFSYFTFCCLNRYIHKGKENLLYLPMR